MQGLKHLLRAATIITNDTSMVIIEPNAISRISPLASRGLIKLLDVDTEVGKLEPLPEEDQDIYVAIGVVEYLVVVLRITHIKTVNDVVFIINSKGEVTETIEWLNDILLVLNFTGSVVDLYKNFRKEA